MPSVRTFTVVLCALFAVALGCQDSSTEPTLTPPERDADALFQTDSLSYTLVDEGQWNANITVQFTNKTGATTYFPNCNGYSALHLEKFVNAAWVPAWTAIINHCGGIPVAVAPNATYKPGILFYAGRVGSNVRPQFSVGPIDGIYRIVWTTSPSLTRDESQKPEDLLPLEQRVSNRFLLKTARN